MNLFSLIGVYPSEYAKNNYFNVCKLLTTLYLYLFIIFSWTQQNVVWDSILVHCNSWLAVQETLSEYFSLVINSYQRKNAHLRTVNRSKSLKSHFLNPSNSCKEFKVRHSPSMKTEASMVISLSMKPEPI